jgi:acyl carrier protein phosphodiesterase
MNYLAHACLSFNEPLVLVGNMISDYVKGKKQYDYLPGIRTGITLHRKIDAFTDEHPVTQELKSFFRPQYRLYSGAFVDVVYDHFLATDTNEFATGEQLKRFTTSTYNILEQHLALTPAPFQQLFPYMQQHDWLYNYQFTSGIEKSFNGLVHRAAYLQESAIAFDIFLNNYDKMKEYYGVFYPLLKNYAAHQLAELSND